MFKKLFFFALTTLCGVCLTIGAVSLASAGATHRYVAPTGTDSGNDCANPNNPCATISHAVQQADAGDTVIIATGWYTETDTVRLFRDMTLQGAGFATTILSVPNDPDIWHALQVYQDVTATVRGLTIRNADRNGVSNLGTLTLDQVSISENRGALGGGGIYNDGTLFVQDSLIVNNQAIGGSVAAGLLNFDYAEIRRTAFIGNQTDGPGTYGGGLHNQGQLTLENVTFALNKAGSGTAISNGGGVITMTHVTIADNASLLPSPDNAQAVTNNGGQISIANSLIGYNGPNQQCTGDTAPLSLGGNLEYANSCGFNQPTDQPNTDPLPLTLGSSSPPWAVVFVLLPNSPAVNAAVNAHCLATDARGVARPYGAACDSGAYEFNGFRVFLPLVIR